MSNTRRHVDPKWGPGEPDFDDWNEKHAKFTHRKPVQSVKHQSRDRHNGRGKDGGCKGNFSPGCRNSRYNLSRKIDELRDQESRDAAED